MAEKKELPYVGILTSVDSDQPVQLLLSLETPNDVKAGQTLIRRRRMRCPVMVSTACLKNVLQNLIKNENTTPQPFKRKLTGPIDNSGKFHSA